jgi:hypothetical protein
MRKIAFVVDIADDVKLPEINVYCDKVAEVMLAPSSAHEDASERRFGSRFKQITITTDDKVYVS